MSEQSECERLQHICTTVRMDIIQMIHQAGSGHPGGSLSAVESIVTLYFTDAFQCFPEKPKAPERDRFILSKGHAAPLLYSVLARRGFFPVENLTTLRTFGSGLQGHPNMKKLTGLDCSSGSLGQGLSIANGLAYAFLYKHTHQRVYCLLGDGELQEGQIWEAALFASQHHLSNLCAIVDCNGIQLDDTLTTIKNMAPLPDKWRSFGWNVIEAKGNDVMAMYTAYNQAKTCLNKPTVILAATIKGKGISFMENQAKWHGTAPNDEQCHQALAELKEGIQ